MILRSISMFLNDNRFSYVLEKTHQIKSIKIKCARHKTTAKISQTENENKLSGICITNSNHKSHSRIK